MANELTLAGELKFVKGDVNIDLGAAGRLTISGTKYTKLKQEIGTSEEAIDLGDLAGSAGYVIMINRDTTNFVELRPGTGETDMIKIRPGLFAIFELASAAPFAIADTAACIVEYLIIPQ